MVLIWLIEDERYENYEFPSPCGDYGSYQLRLSSATTIAPGKSFRPLAGIMVLIMPYDSYKCPDGGVVSVPLRGLWFLSTTTAAGACWRTCRFRPLAGIMVLIFGTFPVQLAGRQGKFPSPCGDYGSYQIGFQESVGGHWHVSVPLRGLWFLSLRTLTMTKTNTHRFRPLAGIMVLIS